MTQFRALYYDGRTSQQREVLVWAEPSGRLRVSGDGVDFGCRIAEVRPSPRVGNTARHLQFPDGSQCETGDNDAVDAVFAALPSEAPGRLIHSWESRYGYALLALALTAAALWAGITYGIPALAKQVAAVLPPSTERALGRDALAALDRVLLAPSKLPPARREKMRALFSHMVSGIEGADGYRLELRAGKRLGANALALPSGEIVVTDQLVEIAEKDDELVAVLAHEIGHLRQRHGLRRLLQDSATVLLIAAVTGDARDPAPGQVLARLRKRGRRICVRLHEAARDSARVVRRDPAADGQAQGRGERHSGLPFEPSGDARARRALARSALRSTLRLE